ncbi:hypothetical protein CQW23_33289 [Capsicum baccatum]|uniref:DOG1 domain-containing protein n=1 Tax=Capsicum baccatum TaxID=33114 RepID=A0A2G2V299_CAPBA|nr:hypothetical protein CQW23_33289 [Capsicum baccatum]
MTTTSNPSTGATSDRTEEESMQCAWKDLQYEELAELQYAAAQAKKGENDDHQLTQLIQKIIQHFQDYTNNHLLLSFVSRTCSVAWTSTLVSLISFKGKRELTSKQMNMIDALQAKTIKQEKILTSKLASLQEDIVDQPIASKIKNEMGECGNADEALDEHDRHMAGIMEEADELRMETLKEIVLNILKPIQAVEYLEAAKRMRLCFGKWGEKRDQQHANKLELSVD